MIDIYCRKDLGMRRGKVCAQAAHAAMKLLLQSTTKVNNALMLKDSSHYDLISKMMFDNSYSIHWVNSESELLQIEIDNPEFSASIVDNGHTEFHGVPTLTCLAVDTTKTLLKVRSFETTNEESPVQMKQVIALRRDLGFSKDRHIALAIISSLNCIVRFFNQDENGHYVLKLDDNKNLDMWLSSAFAKTVVKIEDGDAIVLQHEAKARSIRNVSFCSPPSSRVSSMPFGSLFQVTAISFGPEAKSVVDEVTGKLKLY